MSALERTVRMRAFVAARLDEDEAVALDADEGGLVRKYAKMTPDLIAEHIARHDPARVLREVEAKRAILADCARLEEQVLDGNFWNVTAHESIVARLALAWSEHPDYDPEWRIDL